MMYVCESLVHLLYASLHTRISTPALFEFKHSNSNSNRDRALFSLAYIGSLVLTLYASIWARSYILTVVATAVQLGQCVCVCTYVYV
jgi:hypothetical protein